MADQFIKDKNLEILAALLIAKLDDLKHIELKSVLILRSMEIIPGDALAKCYKLTGHPMQFFTDKTHCIVVDDLRTDYMSENQLKLLLYHELKHIHPYQNKLVDHVVKDFYEMLEIDVHWSSPNVKVPDILKL